MNKLSLIILLALFSLSNVAQSEKDSTTKAITKDISKDTLVCREIFYPREGQNWIQKTEVHKVRELAEFLRDYPGSYAIIEGYASKYGIDMEEAFTEEGKQRIEMNLSKARAERVKQMLVRNYRIEANRITTTFYGSTRQPFTQNEKNRVALAYVISDIVTLETPTNADNGSSQESDQTKVYDIVEQMPSFPGGTSALFEYLSKNIRYPKKAEKKGEQGRVIICFTVERDGSIIDIRTVKSVSPELDSEAQRVVKSMPRWIPGKQNEVAVPVKYTLPINFQLDRQKRPSDSLHLPDGFRTDASGKITRR